MNRRAKAGLTIVNRLTQVEDDERAADLFARILRAVEAEERRKEQKRNESARSDPGAAKLQPKEKAI